MGRSEEHALPVDRESACEALPGCTGNLLCAAGALPSTNVGVSQNPVRV
jgi:hypothetical protein